MTSATTAWVTDIEMNYLNEKNPYDISMTQNILDD